LPTGRALTRPIGTGFFLHNHPEDRPKDVYGGENAIHAGGEHPSCLLIPAIP
jgi:hypothetical protein